jgi:2-aminoethylphosphonate-pyruvate transaminase
MIIFSPGPSNISERVRQALLHPDIGHRDTEFTELLREVRTQLLTVAGLTTGAPYSAVVLGGSGSVAIESVVAAARPAGRLFVIANGPYGERAAAMAQYHGVDVELWSLPWGAAIPLDALEQQLARVRPGAVYCVHHETATGRLNPLREIAAAAKAVGAFMLADTVSSIAGEALDIAGWQLDAVIGSSNKCLRGVPGAAFVIASAAFMELAAAQRGAHYSNLAEHATAEDRGETPFTPPVHALFALREALAETLDEGVAARCAHFAALAEQTLDGLAALGLPLLLPREAYGHTLVSSTLPSQWSYPALHAALKREGFSIYAAQGALKAHAFRLGLIGHFGQAEVAALFAAMSRVLRR